ncbi:hypothetical protein BXY85_2791 [Roseivirga pacifica]|uniref:Uncharacterized protein n=1 Tax=Roseivirga pacifica TaxID=1267423 RepID=A0A1I0P6P3_9BACT|nr:hypothetical protein [Roseivirga pacifica]RKQ51759.1 hypothetical protein BXY85_2791 [Roseivirga pacifica]SEW10064.1 hypothetical protein SAMN05216290_1772 [Roseivirga pacifica]
MTVNDFQKYLILKYGKRQSGVIALNEEHQVITEREELFSRNRLQFILSIVWLLLGFSNIANQWHGGHSGFIVGPFFLIMSFCYLGLFYHKKKKHSLISVLSLTHQQNYSLTEMTDEVNIRNRNGLFKLKPITADEVDNAPNMGSLVDNWRLATLMLSTALAIIAGIYAFESGSQWLYWTLMVSTLVSYKLLFNYLKFIYRSKLIQTLYLYGLTCTTE